MQSITRMGIRKVVRANTFQSIGKTAQQAIKQEEEQKRLENERAVVGEVLNAEQTTLSKRGGLLSLKTDIKEEKKTQLGKDRKFAQVEGSFGVIQLG